MINAVLIFGVMVAMRPEEREILLSNDRAFRNWTIDEMLVTRNKIESVMRFFSASMVLNILLATGATLELIRIILGK